MRVHVKGESDAVPSARQQMQRVHLTQRASKDASCLRQWCKSEYHFAAVGGAQEQEAVTATKSQTTEFTVLPCALSHPTKKL